MKYITLNPFQPNHLIADGNGGASFNWYAIDLSVNISADTGFPLTVGFNIDNIEQELVNSAIEQFLEGCLVRYGLHLMNKWRFQINYKNILSFDKTISIETLISAKVKNPTVVHNFEF
jgi:hypothetical protein